MELFLSILDWTNDILGIIGARLGWVEYFHPEVADHWEDKIDQAQDQFKEWGDSFTRSKFFETLLTLSIPIILLLISIPIMNASPTTSNINLDWYLWVLIFIILIPTIGGLFLYFLSWLIEQLNEITNGHALGSIGLGLILFGLISSGIDKVVSFLFGY